MFAKRTKIYTVGVAVALFVAFIGGFRADPVMAQESNDASGGDRLHPIEVAEGPNLGDTIGYFAGRCAGYAFKVTGTLVFTHGYTGRHMSTDFSAVNLDSLRLVRMPNGSFAIYGSCARGSCTRSKHALHENYGPPGSEFHSTLKGNVIGRNVPTGQELKCLKAFKHLAKLLGATVPKELF